jgi:hypothetical protein
MHVSTANSAAGNGPVGSDAVATSSTRTRRLSRVQAAMGSLIKKRRKRMRKKKHKKMLKRTRWQRRAK